MAAIDAGLYRRASGRCGALHPAVFLDRDGVIVEEVGYLHKVEDIVIGPSLRYHIDGEVAKIR